MSKITPLATAQINGADELLVQLIRPGDMPAVNRTASPAVVRILWPLQPTVVDPQRFPEVAAVIARMFASASTELAAIKARKRPL